MAHVIIKRFVDILFSVVFLLILAVPMLIIAIAVKMSSLGPIFYNSLRIGINNKIFKMPKYRTMYVGTPAVATHLLQSPESHITKLGVFLRKYSLDELPQLWCVLKGDMSFVGPRPALFNQDDLIALRTSKGVHKLLPGITGWAQINGRDELSIATKVEYDEYYAANWSNLFDLKILFWTFLRVIKCDGVNH